MYGDLTDLPAGWFVLHSHDVSDVMGDADLVVIGPGGVFLIHHEHHAGASVWVTEHTVTLNGRDSDHLRNARIDARQVSDQLTDVCGFDVAVQSVLVLIGASTIQTVSRSAEVHVRNQYDLRDWLCKQPERLDAEMVSEVYAVGSSTTTGI